jgi:hypothetical protein
MSKRYSALLWAIAGAALFLGAGAALPMWPVVMVHRSSGNLWDDVPRTGPLWTALQYEIQAVRHWGLPRLHCLAEFVPMVLVLLATGVGFGLLGYAVRDGGRPPPGAAVSQC